MNNTRQQRNTKATSAPRSPNGFALPAPVRPKRRKARKSTAVPMTATAPPAMRTMISAR